MVRGRRETQNGGDPFPEALFLGAQLCYLSSCFFLVHIEPLPYIPESLELVDERVIYTKDLLPKGKAFADPTIKTLVQPHKIVIFGGLGGYCCEG